jgi:hypothetical protein
MKFRLDHNLMVKQIIIGSVVYLNENKTDVVRYGRLEAKET